MIKRGTGGLNFLMGVISNRMGIQIFGLAARPLQFSPFLSEHPNLPIRKTLRRMLGLLTIIILKRVSESIFFQSNKFAADKGKDVKEVANSLMTFNLLKVIHPFQGKKHL